MVPHKRGRTDFSFVDGQIPTRRRGKIGSTPFPAWVYRKYLRDDSLLALEAEAKAAKRGIWGLSESQQIPPWEWRQLNRDSASKAPDAPKSPNKACRIKGNISKSGRIYHVPGSTWYEQTQINEARGERWFCTEEEARAAGWRAPRG